VPFTPRRTYVVTHHEPWYRCVPESGNWHVGTLTRWMAALPAALLSLVFLLLLACVDNYATATNGSRRIRVFGVAKLVVIDNVVAIILVPYLDTE